MMSRRMLVNSTAVTAESLIGPNGWLSTLLAPREWAEWEPGERRRSMDAATPDPDRLIDARAVAELLGVGVDYVWALARKDEIPHVPVGERKMMFRRPRILAWIEELERGG
jgi:excisionase family DNA binding protein